MNQKESLRNIKIGRIYRHFKGDLYLVRDIAEHSETNEPLVIYQKLYDDGSLYARPAHMWLEPVDHQKYPDVKQTLRFELQDIASVVAK
ncbi:DUF1653 domain-containing protein [Candidatus Saccharibacteria bacterium]|nr:DUF1653 domain-containing protein [Candidatus Saccharibacteria bacterium]